MSLNLKEGEYLGPNVKSFEDSCFKLSLTHYESNCQIQKHYHENNYISILTKGKYTEKGNNESIVVNPGNILFRPKSYTHEDVFERNGGTCFNIEFKSEWKERLDINPDLPDEFRNYKAGSFPSLYSLLLNFQNNCGEEFYSEFICDWLFQINNKNSYNKHQSYIQKVKNILENEIELFHSLNSLSERVFVHPVYLARAFKEKTGVTIGMYQLKMKLENAFFLLLNTSLTVSDISDRNGFYDDAHFIRSFKSVYTISPHKFRLTIKS